MSVPCPKATALLAVLSSLVSSTRCVRRPAHALPESITISVPYGIETLDPHASGSAGGLAISANFYEPLVGADAILRPRPALATAWENPDPLTWTFHLRRDARFHSGRSLRSADVAFSIARLREGRGFELAPYADDIAEVETPDAFTVRLRTREPVTIFLAKLQYVFIVPEGMSSDELATRENGTGPYRLIEWKRGSRVAMRAYERYWGGPPSVSRATYRLNRTPAQASADLASGGSQLVQEESGSAESAARVPGARVERRGSLYVSYLAFDASSEVARFCSAPRNPFRRWEVRKAVDLALDRRRLGTELSAGLRPASQCVPPSIFGFDPGLAPAERDTDEARRLMASAGFAGGFRVTLHTRPMFADAGRLVARMLGEVGIGVDLRILADPDFWAFAAGRGATLVLDRFACQTGDASEVFEQLIHAPDPGRHLGESRSVDYSNPELDAMIERSAGELDVARRSEMLREIMRMIARERPIVPLGIGEDVYVIRGAYRWQPREDGDIRAAEISLLPEDSSIR